MMAREFMKLGGQVQDYRAAITVLFERLARSNPSEDTLFEYLIIAYENMKIRPDESCGIEWAHKRALEVPVMLDPAIKNSSPMRKMLYSMCWHLAHHRGTAPFDLSQGLLAKALETDQGTVSAMVEWLVKQGLIVGLKEDGTPAKCRDEEYYAKGKRCKRYRLCSLIDEQRDISPKVNEQFGGMPYLYS